MSSQLTESIIARQSPEAQGIIATVARDLDTVGLAINGATYQHIDVHWVGLFDAVSQMGRQVHPPHYNAQTHANNWARTFSVNVHAHYHLIRTYHGRSREHWPFNEDYLFPQELGLAPTTDFVLPNESSHGDVGTNRAALNMMINAARAAGVPVR